VIDNVRAEQLRPLYSELVPLDAEITALKQLAREGLKQDVEEEEIARGYYSDTQRWVAGWVAVTAFFIALSVAALTVAVFACWIIDLYSFGHDFGEKRFVSISSCIALAAAAVGGPACYIWAREKEETPEGAL